MNEKKKLKKFAVKEEKFKAGELIYKFCTAALELNLI